MQQDLVSENTGIASGAVSNGSPLPLSFLSIGKFFPLCQSYMDYISKVRYILWEKQERQLLIWSLGIPGCDALITGVNSLIKRTKAFGR